MHHRIVLCGFSEFEYRAMRFSFQHPVVDAAARYEVVDALPEAEFAVVDGASASAVKGVVQAGFVARAVFVGAAAPPGAVAQVSRPIDTTRILRALDELVRAQGGSASGRRPATEAREDAAAPPAAPLSFLPLPETLPIATELPVLNEVVGELFDPFRPFDAHDRPPSDRKAGTAPPATSAALYTAFSDDPSAIAPKPAVRRPATGNPPPLPADPRPAAGDVAKRVTPSEATAAVPSAARPVSASRRATDPPPDPNDPSAVVHAAKAAARAKARRARFANDRAASVEPLRGALVVGPDAEANVALCTLLERFGFRPAALSTLLQARQLLADRQPELAAVFLDLPLDDAGLALVQAVRDLPVPTGHAPPAVHLVAASLGPADKVRVALAGLPEPLIKPLARGDVARALERSGVPLPADARRH